MKLRRILTLCLVLCMFALLPTVANAATVDSGGWGDIEWELNSNGELRFFGTGSMGSTNHVDFFSPPWHDHDGNIKSVVIEEGVTTICADAFQGCTSLTKVTIPSTVEVIGEMAFYQCSKLTDLTIPASVTTIKDKAFAATGLTSVEIPQTVTTVSTGLFANCNKLTEVTFHGVITDIGENAFYSCDVLTDVTFEKGLFGEIGNSAFSYCPSITAFEVPEGVERIMEHAFVGCTNLASISLPEGLESIWMGAFRETALVSVTIPQSVDYMGGGVFSFCNALKNITMYTPAVEGIKDNLGGSDVLEYVHVIGNAPVTDENVFYDGNKNFVIYYDKGTTGWVPPTWHGYLIEIWGEPDQTKTGTCGANLTWMLRDGILTISGTGSMQDYSSGKAPWYVYRNRISRIVIEEGVASIGNYAFAGMDSFTSVDIAGSVETIGKHSFYQCYGLTAVNIPNGVASIEDYAFRWCSNLTTVTMADSVTTLGSNVFTECGKLSSIKLSEGLTAISEGLLYNCGNLAEVNIPDGVTEIGDSAFTGCHSLHTLVLPNGLKTIAYGALSNNGLTSITIPASVKTLGFYAFYNCKSLNSVYFTGYAPTFDGYVFQNVTATCYYPAGYQTWTADVLQNYGGTITWVPYDKVGLEITVQPESVDTKSGANAIFAVEAVGKDLTYQWEYRSTSTGTWKVTTQAGNKTATLTIPATVSRNGYQYRCKITDYDGNEIYTDSATLYVQESGLAITTQPESVKVKQDDKVSFTVAAIGDGLTYQWQYRSSATGTWKNTTLNGATTATLHITATTARNGYQYRCVIKDAYGNSVTSDVVTLTLECTLTIISQPETVAAQEGSIVTFTVAASGEGLTYQWQYRTSATGTWYTTTLEGNQTASIRATATQGRNGYQYRCVITDAHGDKVTSDPAMLTFKTGVTITAQPENVIAYVDHVAQFAVKAKETGLSYQWQYRTSSAGSWKDVTAAVGNPTKTLSIGATPERNGFQYRCKITSKAGTIIYSDAATLTVVSELTIASQPASVTAKVDDTVDFAVKAVGLGMRYQWQYRSSVNGIWKDTTAVIGYQSANITLTATTARNGYQYRCKITDRSGKILYTDAATLTVVSGLTITSQPKSVTAKLNDAVSFTVKASGTGLTYQWQWRKNSASSWASTTVSGNKTATISVSATAARNGYQYRCVVKDANGKTVTSNGATLTVEIPLVINTQPENVTANIGDAVSFTVKASGNDLTYQWQYRTSATGTWKNTTLSGAKTATLKATATTARNGFQYRCVVTDSAGEVVNSNAVTLTVK